MKKPEIQPREKLFETQQLSGILRLPNRFLLAWLLFGFALLTHGVTPANAAPTTMVDLGEASPYAVLSGASVGNTVSAPDAPHTTIRGDLGVKADTAPTGFPPGVVTGTIRQGSPVVPAHDDAVDAYNAIADRMGGEVIPGALVGAVLSPGLYTIAGAASNTGTVTLDGGGDPDAVFVFQINGALSFAAGSQVVLTNGAQASRVFWQVNGAGAIGAGGRFVGTMIATDAVAMGNGTLVNGRAIALNGALTLDNNQFYGAPPIVTIDGGETGYTTDTTPTITGTSNIDPPGEVTVTIAGQTLTATPVDGIWSVTSGILPNATYPVEASVIDAAGNTGAATQNLTVDTVPPVITLDGGDSMETNTPTPTISGTTDVVANTVVEVSIDSQTLNVLVQGDQSWNIRAANLPDGTYQVAAAVSDPAGNESIATQAITVDTTPPEVTTSGGSDATTTDTTPTISGTADVPAGTTVRVVIGNQTLTGVVGSDQRWSVNAGALSAGHYWYIVTTSDAAGNEVSIERMLTIEAVPPPVVIVDEEPSITKLVFSPKKPRLDGKRKSSMNKLGPKIRLRLSEAATVRFRISHRSSKSKTFRIRRQGGASTVRIPKRIRKRLSLGRYKLTAMAKDSAGQRSSLRRTILRVVR